MKKNTPLNPGDLPKNVEILSKTWELLKEMIFNLATKMKMMTAVITLSYPWMITTLVEESAKS